MNNNILRQPAYIIDSNASIIIDQTRANVIDGYDGSNPYSQDELAWFFNQIASKKRLDIIMYFPSSEQTEYTRINRLKVNSSSIVMYSSTTDNFPKFTIELEDGTYTFTVNYN